MIIKIKKSIQFQSTLSCIREDGSTTFSKIKKGMEYHDLAHYSVEKSLGFNNAFYGMIQTGNDIQDFDVQRDKRPEHLIPKNLPLESIQVEYIVNQLMLMYMNGSMDSFIDVLKNTLSDRGIQWSKALDEINLNDLISKYKVLILKWDAIGDGDEMVLEF